MTVMFFLPPDKQHVWGLEKMNRLVVNIVFTLQQMFTCFLKRHDRLSFAQFVL